MVKTIETRHQHGKTTKGGAGGDRDEGNRGKVMPPLITEKPLDESGAGGAEIMVVMMQIKQKKQGRGEVDGEEKKRAMTVLFQQPYNKDRAKMSNGGAAVDQQEE